MGKNNNNNNKKISIKEYFDMRFNELKKYIDTKFKHIDTSTKLANDVLNARLENMNEFRNSLKDQTNTFITRAEHDVVTAKYDADIRFIREALAETRGKASQQSVTLVYIIAILGLLVAGIGLVFNIL